MTEAREGPIIQPVADSVFTSFTPATAEYLRAHLKPETLRAKLIRLKEDGIKDPVRLVVRAPKIAVRNVSRVFGGLKEAGFGNPVGVVERAPQIAGLNIQTKLDALREDGIENPVRLVEKWPPIANYDMHRVLGGLREIGFKDPVRLVEKWPQIATHDIQKIRRRLRLIEGLNKRFNLNYSPIETIEAYPKYLSFSKLRIFFYLRVASLFPPSELLYRQLTMRNPFLVFDALAQKMPSDETEIKSVLSRINSLPKEEKSQRIAEIKQRLPQLAEELKHQPGTRETILYELAVNLLRQMGRTQAIAA